MDILIQDLIFILLIIIITDLLVFMVTEDIQITYFTVTIHFIIILLIITLTLCFHIPIIVISTILTHTEIMDMFQETTVGLICQIIDTLRVMVIKIKEIMLFLKKNQDQIMLKLEIHQL